MLCYKDRTYCSSKDCKLRHTCRDHVNQANKEKSESTDTFIRNVIPVDSTDFSQRCKDFYT